MKNFYTRYKIQDTRYKLKAQSLLEALLSIALGVLLIGGSVGLIGLSLKSFNSVKQHLQANTLMRQASEVIISLARDNWHFDTGFNCDSTIGVGCQIQASSTSWVILSDKETSTINSIPYERYFFSDQVSRSDGINIDVNYDQDYVDPNTGKYTIIVKYGSNYVSSSSLPFYLTRSFNNQVFQQTDWSGGSGQTGPISNPGTKFDTSSNINYSSTTGQITLATTTSAGELTSSILDTGVSGGAGFNSLLWLGNGSAKFQIAFSNATSGPWTSYYGCTSDISAQCLNSSYWTDSISVVAFWNATTSYPFLTSGTASPQNNRYIRYKVYLATSTPPTINDIIINWSP